MSGPGDARLERILANVLWTGVVASSLSLAVGLALTLVAGDAASRPWLTIGLLTLMATPVARVAVSAMAYVLQRDWLFAVLTSLVLLELAASVVTALVFRAGR